MRIFSSPKNHIMWGPGAGSLSDTKKQFLNFLTKILSKHSGDLNPEFFFKNSKKNICLSGCLSRGPFVLRGCLSGGPFVLWGCLSGGHLSVGAVCPGGCLSIGAVCPGGHLSVGAVCPRGCLSVEAVCPGAIYPWRALFLGAVWVSGLNEGGQMSGG